MVDGLERGLCFGVYAKRFEMLIYFAYFALLICFDHVVLSYLEGVYLIFTRPGMRDSYCYFNCL